MEDLKELHKQLTIIQDNIFNSQNIEADLLFKINSAKFQIFFDFINQKNNIIWTIKHSTILQSSKIDESNILTQLCDQFEFEDHLELEFKIHNMAIQLSYDMSKAYIDLRFLSSKDLKSFVNILDLQVKFDSYYLNRLNQENNDYNILKEFI